MPSMMKLIMTSSAAATARADALWTIKSMQTQMWNVMVANSTQTSQVLALTLADPNECVRANAAVLMCDMLDCIENRAERMQFTPLIAPFCKVLETLAVMPD